MELMKLKGKHLPMVVASVFAIFFIGIGSTVTFFGQTESEAAVAEESVCSQPSDVRDQLIAEAEREYFNVRYVEFVGNTYTRGRALFKSSRSVNEGDIFTRKNLELALKRLSKMRSIQTVVLDEVEVRLDRPDKSIDITICVKQKPKR